MVSLWPVALRRAFTRSKSPLAAILIEHKGEGRCLVNLSEATGVSRFGSKPLGAVWVKCPYPILNRGLAEILSAEAHVLHGPRPGPEETPSSVVYCPNGEVIVQEVGRLKALASGAPVLVLGLSNDLSLARSTLQAGARGFLHIGMPDTQIVRALHLAQKGQVVVPRELVTELISKEEPPDLLSLTARQREILNLVAEGMTNAQIAARLYLSEYTIKQHLRAAYKILNVRNRTEASRLLQSRL